MVSMDGKQSNNFFNLLGRINNLAKKSRISFIFGELMDNYDTFRFILHLLFIFLMVLGSLLILLAIYITKQHQSPSGLLIGNLALTDLLIGAFLFPFGIPAIFFEGWTSGRELCVLNGFTNQCLSSVAILTLATISVDRYVAIIHAVRYQQIMTLKKVGLIIIAVWAFGFVSSIFPLLGWGRYVYQHGASLCVTDFKTNKSFTFFIFAVVFSLPLNVMFFIYFRIYKAVRRHARAIRTNSIHPTNEKTYELGINNEVRQTNHVTVLSTNEKGQTNQDVDQLPNENKVKVTNQKANQLTNDSRVQGTNQVDDQLTNEIEVQIISQTVRELTNKDTVQQTNQMDDQLTNENKAKLTNNIIGQSANETVVQITNQRAKQWVNEYEFRSTVQRTNHSAVHPTMLQTLANHRKVSPTNHMTPNNTFSTNKNPLSTNQNEGISKPANQKKKHKPTKKPLQRAKSFNTKLKKETKAALTMLGIISAHVLCLTPFAVYSLYCLHTGNSDETADFVTSKIAYSNAFFNPLIYGLMNTLFRQGFYQIFYMIFRCKKRPNERERRFSIKSSSKYNG